MLRIDYFLTHPQAAWQDIKPLFYDVILPAKPNPAHIAIARMEAWGIVKAVITQNIDNLHQAAGSKVVHEFHGTIRFLTCIGCNAEYAVNEVSLAVLPPRCTKCQSVLKPGFVFFGEPIPEKAGKLSYAEADIADVFLVIGTSGEVMPACMIPYDAKQNGAGIIEVNPVSSAFSNGISDIFLQGKAGVVMKAIEQRLEMLMSH